MVECGDCGKDLDIDDPSKIEVDWVKVVCSDCGNVEEISMVRLRSEQ